MSCTLTYDGANKDNLHFVDQSKQVVFLYFSAVLSKRNDKHLSSQRNTCESFGELEKSCGITQLTAPVPTAFLVLPNFNSLFVYILMETLDILRM